MPTGPELLRSAEFCYTWLIPFHFSLTRLVTYLTILTLALRFNDGVRFPPPLG
jgi:hypothetical protein